MKLTLERLPGIRTPARILPTLQALAQRMQPRRFEIQVVLGDDALLRQLNRDYRHIDRTTDVLSFSYETAASGADPPHAEIYISIPRAQRQAQECQHPLNREVVLLVLHGLLHLQGHDHQELSDAKRMRRAEQPLLRWLHRHRDWPLMQPRVGLNDEKMRTAVRS